MRMGAQLPRLLTLQTVVSSYPSHVWGFIQTGVLFKGASRIKLIYLFQELRGSSTLAQTVVERVFRIG